MRTPIAFATAVLLTACSQSQSPGPGAAPAATPTARAAETGPCAEGYVEISANKPACGIALQSDGSLAFDAKRTQPIIVSYQESADGQVALPAREVVLFPPSPQNGLRVVQACESPDANSLCWATRLLDPKSAMLHEITAGKYGPSHWVSWSPDERRVALISRNEGAEWLSIIDTASGAATTYPSESENVNWLIDRASFTWIGGDAFSVAVRTCDGCVPETRRFSVNPG